MELVLDIMVCNKKRSFTLYEWGEVMLILMGIASKLLVAVTVKYKLPVGQIGQGNYQTVPEDNLR
eukprot:1832175-Ditylum_brightwellii.AAC.2